MIDPVNVTNYDMTIAQMEESILFWICAAGKNGKTAAKCLESLLSSWRSEESSPFSVVRRIIQKGNLAQEMRKHGIGCFNNKARSFADLIQKKLDLGTCTVEELEKVKGIGPKTARCYLIHSRRNQNYAGLDRHILSFLRDLGYAVPDSTPASKKYRELEVVFLGLSKSAKMNASDLDLRIWNAYSGNKGKPEDVLAIFRK